MTMTTQSLLKGAYKKGSCRYCDHTNNDRCIITNHIPVFESCTKCEDYAPFLLSHTRFDKEEVNKEMAKFIEVEVWKDEEADEKGKVLISVNDITEVIDNYIYTKSRARGILPCVLGYEELKKLILEASEP